MKRAKGKQADHGADLPGLSANERSGKATRNALPWLGGILAVCMVTEANAFDSGSTGADGEFSPTSNIEVQLPPSGILNYTTVNIPAGVTVKFKRNAANTPAYVLASGNVTIAGTIDVSGENSTDVGTAGSGNIADDGLPGRGGPGGFDGGRGGLDGLNNVRGPGGYGLGPGGGRGGDGSGYECTNTGYFHMHGMSAAHAVDTLATDNGCTPGSFTYKASAYGSNLLQPLIGGSGGGGGYGGTQFSGVGGGGGGGALLIASSATIGFTGAINAIGGSCGSASGSGIGGTGGAGSGGAVRLVATTVTGNGSINAAGGVSTAYGTNYGAYGSSGRIRLEADSLTYTGGTNPPRVYSAPNPVFVANVPTLKIASVAGQAAPNAPTGVGDVTLPANIGTVNVIFASANVPVGTQVKLRVVPTIGAVVDADPVLIGGSSEAGTATVAVTLPQGSSTLQATAIYTVTLAAAESQRLTQYAQNEVVEKVQLTVDTQRGTLAKLITASGKTYDIPYELLRASGVRG